MKNNILVLALLFISTISTAQNNILAGRVTDENSDLVSFAVIKLYNHSNKIIVKADNNGLYYTKPLEPGIYRIRIEKVNKKVVTGKVVVTGKSKEKIFYNFCLKNNKSTVDITTKDPFMAVKMAEANNQDPRKVFIYDAVYDHQAIIMLDSSGKITGISSSDNVPLLK